LLIALYVGAGRAFFDILKAASSATKDSSVPVSQVEAILACLTAAPKCAPLRNSSCS